MDKVERNKLYEEAKSWVVEAGELIRASLDKKLQIDTKSDANDLVTEMDRESEKFFVDKIKSNHPSHKIISEEGFGDDLSTLEGTVWILDPIDGTMNFVHQKRNFAISLAIYQDGVGEIGLIYSVMEDVLYHVKRGEGAFRNKTQLSPLKDHVAIEESILLVNSSLCCENKRLNHTKIQELVKTVRGTRSYGSGALEFAGVADGTLDAYISMRLSPWDFAAGAILIEEVGGVITQIDGSPLDFFGENTSFSGNPFLKDEIINNYIELK